MIHQTKYSNYHWFAYFVRIFTYFEKWPKENPKLKAKTKKSQLAIIKRVAKKEVQERE